MVLTTCGFLTLSVGGVGIANMMFLILTERTAEIGLRMALGAQQSQILRQFLIESGVLVGIGGAIGIAFSTVVIVTLQQLSLPSWLGRPELSLETMMIALSVLFVVAFLAGFFPARRAANMNPVTALAF
jgi:putative ABC transport system permease protein